MEIETTRFGSVQIEAEDILLFPSGLVGMEQHRHWVLLADAENDSVAWLQSVSEPTLAMAAISPRRFVPDYRVRISPAEMTPIQLGASDDAFVLAIVSLNHPSLTANLKAPIIINLQRRLGRQVVTLDDQPLRHELAPSSGQLRKTA